MCYCYTHLYFSYFKSESSILFFLSITRRFSLSLCTNIFICDAIFFPLCSWYFNVGWRYMFAVLLLLAIVSLSLSSSVYVYCSFGINNKTNIIGEKNSTAATTTTTAAKKIMKNSMTMSTEMQYKLYCTQLKESNAHTSTNAYIWMENKPKSQNNM